VSRVLKVKIEQIPTFNLRRKITNKSPYHTGKITLLILFYKNNLVEFTFESSI